MVQLIKQDYEKNKKLYDRIVLLLRQKIKGSVPISHVGSTALPDMIGKNIIDILIGANNQNEFIQLFKVLCDMGYFPSENSKTDIYQFFASKKEETKEGDVHIHLVMQNTDRYRDFLILRDYLLSNHDEAKAYADFKSKIINEKTRARKEYRTIKSEYVTDLINRAKNTK